MGKKIAGSGGAKVTWFGREIAEGAWAQSPKSKSGTGGGPSWKGIRQRRRHVGKNDFLIAGIVFLGYKESKQAPAWGLGSEVKRSMGECL